MDVYFVSSSCCVANVCGFKRRYLMLHIVASVNKSGGNRDNLASLCLDEPPKCQYEYDVILIPCTKCHILCGRPFPLTPQPRSANQTSYWNEHRYAKTWLLFSFSVDSSCYERSDFSDVNVTAKQGTYTETQRKLTAQPVHLLFCSVRYSFQL